MAKSRVEEFKQEIFIPEAIFSGLFWASPKLYEEFPADKIGRETFTNPIWGFYFGLGRYMYEKNVKIFDDITTFKHVSELKIQDQYDQYGNYETIKEIMDETDGKFDNVEAYFEDIKKYERIRQLAELFGAKVLETSGKYDYHKLSKEQIQIYWNDKLNKLALHDENGFDEAYLLEGLEEAIERWDKSPSIGLEFFNSKKMTSICSGWEFGHTYIYGSFGGRGKTSFTWNKVVMSCITHQEKLLIVANEQDVEDFQKMLIITAMGILEKESKDKEYFNRKRINEGSFKPEERERLQEAVEWVRKTTEGDQSLIKFVFMESFTMDNVKKVAMHYAVRGYRSMIIDTGKPSDNIGGMARWEAFTEDFKKLYQIIRPNAGGLNMRCWVNVQLADAAVNRRYLNEQAFGDSKKIKNEASVVFMGRPLFDDEYEGGDRELTVYRWVKSSELDEEDEFNDFPADTFVRVEEKLKREYQVRDKETNKVLRSYQNLYYLFFTPKNRRGQDANTGLDVLVMRANFNSNTWTEVGFTTVRNDTF